MLHSFSIYEYTTWYDDNLLIHLTSTELLAIIMIMFIKRRSTQYNYITAFTAGADPGFSFHGGGGGGEAKDLQV